MKTEKKSNGKKLIWLSAAIIVLLASVGIILALLLPGGTQQEVATGPAVLYWNVDRLANLEEGTGLSLRTRDEDGLFHIRFAIDGQQVELPITGDKRLVNYIDSMDVMGLIMDSEGVVIDAVEPKQIADETAKDFFVKKVDGDKLIVNSSVAMNGMEVEVVLSETTGIYDVDPTAEVVGQPGTPQMMDKVSVYSEKGTQNVTHVFLVEHPVDAGVYWRVERCWDAGKGKTTRIPDENGIYTMEFAHDGKMVELKCKEAELVSKIDGASVLYGQFAFRFDEEGYIVDTVDVGMAIRGAILVSDFHITGINGDTYTATRLSTGSNQGQVVTFTLAENCDIFQCCQYGCYDSNCGERVSSLRLNDRVNVYTNLDGEAALIFISRRTVDSAMYFNYNRQYSGNAEKGTNRAKVNGYYVFEMLKDGEVVKVRTKDKAIADQMEAIWNRCMGLKLNGDIVERVYDATCIYGGAPVNSEGVVSSLMGSVIVVSGTTSDANALLSADCKVYNAITREYGKKVGGTLTLQVGDQVTSYRNAAGEVCIVFVLARQAEGAKVYYNLNRSYDSEKQQTTRTPDENGYYVFEMVCEGKPVTVKTKSKGMASFIDQQQAPLVGLKVNSSGVVTNAYVVTSAMRNAAKACNYRYVENVTKTSFNTFYYPAATPNVKTVDKDTYKMAENCVVYNVSQSYTSHRGEKTTLKNGDYIQAIKDLTSGEIIQIFIMQRDPTYGVASYKANCSHCGKNVTWKPYNGRIPNEDAHYFACADLTFPQGIIGKKDDGKTYDIVLDLKGHTLTGAGRAFLVYDKLTVMDTKGGGKIVGTSTGIGLAGGSVMVGDGGILNLYGGELTLSNKSTAYGTGGGVLYIGGKGATVNMTGGKIAGGISSGRGGNVVVYGGTFNMSGGTIEGGTAPSGNNIYLSSNSTFTMTGGTIDGGVYILTKTSVTLSGAPVISGTGMEIISGQKIDISGLTKGASIVINGSGFFTQELSNAESYKDYFKPVETEHTIEVSDNALKYVIPGQEIGFVLDSDGDGKAICPVCGGEEVQWTAISGTGSVSVTSGAHYYLEEDIESTAGAYMTLSAKTACLHLNGRDLTYAGRIFLTTANASLFSRLNIMGNGTVTSTGTHDTYATGTIHLAGTVELNLYGGTYRYEGSTYAPIRVANANGVANVYEGVTIDGGNSTAVLLEKGKLNLLGGTVIGNVNATGGTMTLYGAAVADSINIGTNAKLTVNGDWSGKATVAFASALIDNAVPTANGASTGDFTGELTLVADGDPILHGKDGKLVIDGDAAGDGGDDGDDSDELELDPNGNGYCKVCKQTVSWTAITGIGSVSVTSGAHYYLANDIVSTAGAYMTLSAKTACLHLNGHDLTYAGRIFLTTANANLFSQLNIMGNATVTSTGTHDTYATGTIHLAGTVELNLYGGTYKYEGSTYAPIRVAAANAIANVYEGVTIDGGNGTAVLVEKGKFNLNGGTVTGGVNATGGTVTLGGSAIVTGKDGALLDNIAISANAKLIVSADFTGVASASFAALTGNTIPEANGVSQGAYIGKLYLEIAGTPAIIGKEGRLVLEEVPVTP